MTDPSDPATGLPGSLPGLGSALAGLGGSADAVADCRRALERTLRGIDAAWLGPRHRDFAAGGARIGLGLADLARVLDEGIGLIERQRASMASAQEQLAAIRADAARIRSEGDHQARALQPGRSDQLDSSLGPSLHRIQASVDLAMLGLEEEAQRIRHQFESSSGEIAGALDAVTRLLEPTDAVPGGTDDWMVLGASVRPLPAWAVWAAEQGLPAPKAVDPVVARLLARDLRDLLSRNPALPADRRAALIRRWAERQEPADLVDLAVVLPQVIGNLDGIPNQVRYVANRVRISAELVRARVGLTDLPGGRTEARKRLEGRIGTLSRLLGEDQQGRPFQVLAFTPPRLRGAVAIDDGRLAVVVGDLDHASRVGVVVPGITNRIDNFIEGTLDKARRAQELVRDSATIAWLGYDTPELADSVSPARAREGGRELHDFLLGTQRRPDSRLAVLAHSYGTLVVAEALRRFRPSGARQPGRQGRPDQVVLFGSPGLGREVHSTRDLGLPPGYPIYALRARGDLVAAASPYGRDPAELPGVTRLETGTVTGHSDYTRPGSLALANIAGVLAGDPRRLAVGGEPLSSGRDGSYAVGLRRLVDHLEHEVSETSLARFGAAMQETALELEGRPPSTPLTAIMVAGALDAAVRRSGLHRELTVDELAGAIRHSGLLETTALRVGDAAGDLVDRQDQLDDLPIRYGPMRITPPDGLNELAGRSVRAQTTAATYALEQLAILTPRRAE